LRLIFAAIFIIYVSLILLTLVASFNPRLRWLEKYAAKGYLITLLVLAFIGLCSTIIAVLEGARSSE
jgi:hypothetical protein